MYPNFLLFKNLERRFTIFRWGVILIMAPVLLLLSNYHSHLSYLIIILVIGSIYNILITAIVYEKTDKFQFILKHTLYFDIPLISIFVFSRGGLRSDTYLLYFLIILYNGAKFGYKGTINSLLQIIIYYTIAAFFFTDPDFFSLNRYIIRIGYFITLTFVMYEVNHQISESHANEKVARELAYKDPLTKLPNRLMMSEEFEKKRITYENTGESFAVVIMDIDNFKQVNDTLGHAFGDYVLQEIGKIFNELNEKDDFICRFGGEEFLAFFDYTTYHELLKKVRVLQDKITQHDFKGSEITVSIGINTFKNEYTMIENISFADEAMYAVKNTGKNMFLNYEDLKLQLK